MTARPERPEALQGFHADTLSFFIEEASGIDDIIFETAGGALSSTDAWVFMFANPTRAQGYFHRSHGTNRDAWRTFRVDRMTGVEPTGEPAVRPEGFDLDATWRDITDEVEERRSPVRARATRVSSRSESVV